MEHPKLRDSKRLLTREPYPINEIPEEVIKQIGKRIVYMLCVGYKDLTGDDWGNVFAESIDGIHLQSPVGIADVVYDKMAWSMKTVKSPKPHKKDGVVRLISGRCSPDYSYGITDPHEDIQKTGRAVLNIWNERVNIAQDYYNPLRTAVLVRSDDLLSFCMFEEENHRYPANSYKWEENNNGNLIGLNIETGQHKFTWQPHGSQFTILTEVPANAIKFRIKQPPKLSMEETLKQINYSDDWVEII
ncbi:MAG: hypothetical protein K6G73_13045 [Marinilabiliaceae bacterium]|nr:hypothetical protein [Marinilabiliaceae bacterium]